jgi:hypothetical protein
MNVFFIDRDPDAAAKAMINKHVVKMVLECAQLLSTCHRVYGDEREILYKETHKNHPCAVWIRESTLHYDWVYEHMMALGREYSRRYGGKTHLSITKLSKILKKAPKKMKKCGWSDPPQCMPEEYQKADTLAAYRAYYQFKRDTIGDK